MNGCGRARAVPFVALAFACTAPTLEIQRDSPEWLSTQLGPVVRSVVGPSRVALFEQWGEATSVALDTTLNLHVAGQVDTLATFRYEGFEAVYYVVSSSEREFLTHLEVTGPGYLTGLPFDVGSTVESIVDALGPPTSETDSEIRYADEYDVLVFAIDGGHVSWIKYMPYVD